MTKSYIYKLMAAKTDLLVPMTTSAGARYRRTSCLGPTPAEDAGRVTTLVTAPLASFCSYFSGLKKPTRPG